ncbi:uncharacterized protein LOC141892171 [Acropora palmata]|uniref:uncharacterized protein LOC141892171 n=1 Tax=Acropora palmata TaxID=6131 RepID=UPI003DA1BCE2
MARQFWLEVITLVVVSLVLGSRGSRKDSGTKLLDDLLEKVVDIIAKNDKCKGLDNKLPPGCSITEDCFRVTCAKKVDGKDISLKMKFNRCDKPFTATINVQVEKENVEWSHVFNSGEEMAVGKTDIYVKVVELKDEDGKLQVRLEVKGKADSFEVPKTQLPISTEYCGFVRWWFDKNTAVRISVTTSFLLVVLFIITGGCFCCCCCCCKPCKKRSENRVV